MSQRGSFVTEYIYCDACFEVAKEILGCDRKFLRGVAIKSWTGCIDKELPIVAGKIGGSGRGDELLTFEFDLGPKLSARLCHPLRVAVLAEHTGRPKLSGRPRRGSLTSKFPISRHCAETSS